MAFHDISGNKRAKGILIKALQRKRVPNSLIFTGPEGIGKKSLALVMAKALNCLKKTDDACESCSSCLAINKENFPDVMIISPKKEIIKIEQMRDMKQTAYLKPMVGKKRIFIIEEAEAMKEEASNSLLKILEEPPLYAHIILLTQNLDKVLPTIRSRCQILSFVAIAKEDIENILLEKGYEVDRARVISLLVRGNLKQAIEVDWEEVQMKRQQAWSFLLSLLGKKKASFFLDRFTGSKALIKDELEEVLEIVCSFCRDLLLMKGEENVRFIVNPDYEEDLRKVSHHTTFENVLDLLERIDRAIYAIERNLNIGLVVSALFSNIMEWEYV